MRRALPLVLLVGCSPGAGVPVAAEPTPGASASCEAPYEGFDRLTEGAAGAGVDLPPLDPEVAHPHGTWMSPLAVVDLDGDGDLDIAAGRADDSVDLYRNDGGTFTALEAQIPPSPDSGQPFYVGAMAHFFVDLDGDGLPELLRPGFGLLAMHRNLGDLDFGPAEFLYVAPDEGFGPVFGTLTAGDLDGDGDVDLVLPTLHGALDLDHQGPLPGAADVVLLQQPDGSFLPSDFLTVRGLGTMSQLALLTDRDLDGDLDLYIGADLKSPSYPPAGFFTNDGASPPGLVDEAEDIGLAHRVSGMGADVDDWNGDGLPDLCISDTGPVVCAESLAGQPWVDLTALWSLEPAPLAGLGVWTGWSVVLADLDNDGRRDLAVAAGRPDDVEGGQGNTNPFDYEHPDGLWRRSETGWEDAAADIGFDSLSDDYGLAAGDLDGDGYLEIVVNGHDGPRIWWNRCGAGAWLEVDVAGASGDTMSFGARVEVDAGGGTQVQEVPGPRTVGQPPPRLHFGLGGASSVDAIRVRWPDGAAIAMGPQDVNRRVRVEHPDR